MEIRVLGPLGATDAGRQVALGGGRQRSVLAGLVIHAGEAVSTPQLIDLVWGEDPPPTARKSLQTYVSRLRRILGSGLITGAGNGYRLQATAEQLDVLRFQQLADQGRRWVETDPVAAWDTLSEALGLWRGAPLSDLEANGELLVYVERLQEARLAAIEDRIEAGLNLGQHVQLIGELRALVEAHPHRERLDAPLIVALYRSGRQAEALEVHRRSRQRLADELGRTVGGVPAARDPDPAAGSVARARIQRRGGCATHVALPQPLQGAPRVRRGRRPGLLRPRGPGGAGPHPPR
jgi:DNA-binding SARP family transcriptional activator